MENLVQDDGNHHAEIAEELEKKLTLADDHDEVEDEDDDGDGDFEFFFAGSELTSPVAAEEVFQNGQIRPFFQFSDDHVENSEEATPSYGPSVRKLFVVSSAEENEAVAEGPYCAWSAKSPDNSPEPAPEMSRKSNSTGFSKLWRVKDLLVRSHSDGKDAFVFLMGKSEEKVIQATSSRATEDDAKKMKKKVVNLANLKAGETASSGDRKGKKKTTTAKSAYEALYGGKREKKAGKSYLPYRQDLVGFFTNANGMSRNVHPY